jgi:hypothetical protein
MLQRCEKEQCAQNFSGSLKNELTAERMVPKRRLESRLLGIMKATSMHTLEAAKLATNERGSTTERYLKSRLSWEHDLDSCNNCTPAAFHATNAAIVCKNAQFYRAFLSATDCLVRKYYVNIYAARLAPNNRSDQPRKTKILRDGKHMQSRYEKEQCEQNFCGLRKAF